MATVLKQRLDIIEVAEATALGAALLGGMGAGLFDNPREVHKQLRYSQTSVEPLADQVDLYDAIFREVYQEIYPSLRELNHANYRFKYGLVE